MSLHMMSSISSLLKIEWVRSYPYLSLSLSRSFKIEFKSTIDLFSSRIWISFLWKIGTVKPVRYIVIENDNKVDQKLPLADIQNLTFTLCYLYPNWSDSIKLPAPTQLAHKVISSLFSFVMDVWRIKTENIHSWLTVFSFFDSWLILLVNPKWKHPNIIVTSFHFIIICETIWNYHSSSHSSVLLFFPFFYVSVAINNSHFILIISRFLRIVELRDCLKIIWM
jgi:hypothetical protein